MSLNLLIFNGIKYGGYTMGVLPPSLFDLMFNFKLLQS